MGWVLRLLVADGSDMEGMRTGRRRRVTELPEDLMWPMGPAAPRGVELSAPRDPPAGTGGFSPVRASSQNQMQQRARPPPPVHITARSRRNRRSSTSFATHPDLPSPNLFPPMSTPFDYNEHPHRRFNPLLRRWHLVSPHRAKRPWQGSVEALPPDTRPPYDPADYLGPGNWRVSGSVQNPDYTSTYVFDNDFQALLKGTPAGAVGSVDNDDLFVARSVRGCCRVVCFSPRLNVTVAEMTVEEVRPVVDAWCSEYRKLAALDYVGHVQIFENKGEMMGCSNPHPHGQIWASEFIPEEPATVLANLAGYFERNSSHMLEDYARKELKDGSRVVCQNDTFLAVVPFWAVWPFEVLVASKKRIACLNNFTDAMKHDLADIYRRVTARYDNLFTTLFPYSMGIHQAPTVGEADPAQHAHAHFHMHFYPPLLRSATVRKFMVGFEMLAESQRDLTAEQAAQRLRECSETHFNRAKRDAQEGANP